MKEEFESNTLSTLEDCCDFFITVLEEIHPFMDGNRRTVFLAFEAQLMHL
jgi:prophage maintenance system killer protein